MARNAPPHHRAACPLTLPPSWDARPRDVTLVAAAHRWDKIHDLCFLCKDKAQLWKPITTQSVVVHIKGHQANPKNFHDIHRNFTRICSGECLRKHLPFDVPSLADLCNRGNIRLAYSKCTALELH